MAGERPHGESTSFESPIRSVRSASVASTVTTSRPVTSGTDTRS
jgi:hypothetical protein